MKPVCKDTHSFILAGRCHWCGIAIESGQPIELEALPKGDQRQWNIPALIGALRDKERKLPMMVVANMMFDGSHSQDVLQVLRAALANDCPDVVFHATMALVKLGYDLLAPESHGFEKTLA